MRDDTAAPLALPPLERGLDPRDDDANELDDPSVDTAMARWEDDRRDSPRPVASTPSLKKDDVATLLGFREPSAPWAAAAVVAPVGTPVDRPPVARLPSGSSKVVSERFAPPPFVFGSYALRCLIDLIVFVRKQGYRFAQFRIQTMQQHSMHEAPP